MEKPSLTMAQCVVPDAALTDVPATPRAPAEPTPGAAGSAGNGSAPRGRL